MLPFSVLTGSAGKPLLLHSAISLSVVNTVSGFTGSNMGNGLPLSAVSSSGIHLLLTKSSLKGLVKGPM